MTEDGNLTCAVENSRAPIAATTGGQTKKLRLRTRLGLLVLIALIPSIIVLAFLYRGNQTVLSREAQEQALRLSRLVASAQASRIDAARQVTAVLAGIPEVRDGIPGKCSAVLAAVSSALKDSGYGAAALVRPDGTLYCADVPVPADADRSGRPFFKNVMANHQFSVGAYRMGGLSKAPVLVVAHPVLGADGQVANIIALSITIEWFNKLLAELALPASAVAMVIDAEGTILARYPDSAAWVGQNIADTPIFHRIRAEKTGMADEIGADGFARLVGFAAVGGDLGEVYVTVGFDRAEVLGANWQDLMRGPGLVAIVSFLTLGFILFGLQRILLRNLDNLLATSQRVAGGDLSARTGLTNEPGEFGELGRSFDAMTTALDRRESQLKARTDELSRSNEELQQFAYVASHDLQEPLRMVSSFVQLLARQYQGKLDADADEYIGFAVDGATRMQKLIEGLLSFSRIRTRGQEFKPVDCEALLADVMFDLTKVIEETGATVTHETLPTIIGDGSQLAQVFQNLIGNAIKFHGQEPPTVHVSAAEDKGAWTFAVRDNGIGIDPQFNEKVFLIFQRLHTRTEYPGLGIGLAVCKRILERHGGRLWLDSEPGKGTTFHFSVPKTRSQDDSQSDPA